MVAFLVERLVPMKTSDVLSRIPLRAVAIWIVVGILLPIIASNVLFQRLSKNQGVTLNLNETSDEESFRTALKRVTENRYASAQIISYVWVEKQANYLLLVTGLRKCRLYINENLVVEKIKKVRGSTTMDLPRGFALMRLEIDKMPDKMRPSIYSKDTGDLDFQWSRDFVHAEPIRSYQSFHKPVSPTTIQLGKLARILGIVARFNVILVIVWILFRIFNIPLIPKESGSVLWLLVPALIAMLWLRFAGIGYLMEEGLHPDEKMYAKMTREVFSGNLAPLNFWYTTGFFYIASATQKCAFWLFGDLVTRNMVLRFLSALFSWLSCILVYSIGRVLLSKTAGILAMLLFGFSFMPIELAHFSIVEPTMVFFFLLAFLALVKLNSESSRKEFVKAGLLAGVAVAVKQTAAIIAIPFVFTCAFLIWQGSRKVFQKFAAWIAAAFVGFFLLSPGTILNFSEFYKYQAIQYHSLQGETHTRFFFLHEDLTRGTRVLANLHDAIGYPIMIAACVGLIFVWRKWPKAGLLLSSVTITYLIIASNTTILPEHYVLILCPFFAIFAAGAIDSIPIMKPAYQKVVFAGLVVLLLYPSAEKLIQYEQLIHGKDTRTEASEWCYKNLRPTARIDRELFGPQFLIPMFDTSQIRLFKRPRWEDYVKRRKPQYLIEDNISWDRFLAFEKDFPIEVEWGNNLRNKGRLVKEFHGRKFRLLNPDIRIYEIPEEPASPLPSSPTGF